MTRDVSRRAAKDLVMDAMLSLESKADAVRRRGATVQQISEETFVVASEAQADGLSMSSTAALLQMLEFERLVELAGHSGKTKPSRHYRLARTKPAQEAA